MLLLLHSRLCKLRRNHKILISNFIRQLLKFWLHLKKLCYPSPVNNVFDVTRKKFFMRNRLLAALIVGVTTLGLVLPTVAQTYNNQPLRAGVVYVPAGTLLETSLTSPIDSSLAKPGDTFNAKIISPVYLGNDLVFPTGTTLEGMVVSAQKAGRMGVNGTMDLRLTTAVTPDGLRYPLSGIISKQNDKIDTTKDGALKGRSTKTTVGTGAARVVAWTAGGVLLGIIFAPIVAGAVGAGAIAGVATGAAVGGGSDLWRKGINVSIPSGTRLAFQLDQPLSLSTGSGLATSSQAPTATH
jgi:hypothetical protein